MNGNWRLHAACRGLDAEIWYPMPGDHETRARAIIICASCPVTSACEELAERHGTSAGIYAGRDYSLFPVRSRPERAGAVAS